MGCVNSRPIKHPKKPLPTIPSAESNGALMVPNGQAVVNPQQPRPPPSPHPPMEAAMDKPRKKSLFSTLKSKQKLSRSPSESSSVYSGQRVNGGPGAMPVNRAAPTQNPGAAAAKSTKTVIALYAYESRDEGELSLEKNDKLVIVDDSEPDWWLAYKLTEPDRRGYIPMNFVVSTVIETEE